MKLPLLGLALLFPNLSFASQQVQNHDILHPAGMVTGNASEVLVGRFNGDVIPDGLVLQDGDLVLIDAPDRISYFTKVEGAFTSICKVNLTTGRDGVLASSAAGLSLFTWDQGMLDSSVVSTHADWVAATQLQAIQRSGTSTKICGVSASGTKILYAEWSGSAFSPLTAIVRGSTILALAGLYWDGGHDLDFAYDLGGGVEVISHTALPFGSMPQVCATPRLLRLPIPGYNDGVLWLTNNPTGGQRLLSLAPVIQGTGIAVMQQFLCAPNTVERMTLANFDQGTDTDLVLSISKAEGRYFRVLYRIGPAHFGIFGNTGEPTGVELSLAGVWGTSCNPAPAVGSGDMDGDGDDELLFAGHAGCTARAKVFFANGVDEERDNQLEHDDHIKPWLFQATLVPKGSSNEFHLSAWPKPIVGPAVNATDIHVRVFSGSGLVVSSAPMADEFFSFQGLIPDPIVLTFGQYLPEPMYFEFSYVTRSDGIVTSAFPAWVGTYDEYFPYEDGGKSTGGFDRPPRPPSGP